MVVVVVVVVVLVVVVVVVVVVEKPRLMQRCGVFGGGGGCGGWWWLGGGGGAGASACLQAKTARKKLVNYLESAKVSCAADLKQCFEDHRRDLFGSDPFFGLEEWLLECLHGDAAKERVKTLIRAAFPAQDRIITVADSLLQLQALVGADSFKLLPTSAQSELRFAVKMAAAVSSGTIAQIKTGQISQFWTECWQSLPFFVRYQGRKNAESEVEQHCGVPALCVLIFELSTKKGISKDKKASEEPNQDDIKLLRQFSFFVPGSHAAKLQAILDAKPPPKAKAKAKPKKGTKKDDVECATVEAISIFGS